MSPFHPADRNAAPDIRLGTADTAVYVTEAAFTEPQSLMGRYSIFSFNGEKGDPQNLTYSCAEHHSFYHANYPTCPKASSLEKTLKKLLFTAP